jgi:hypothetical protein
MFESAYPSFGGSGSSEALVDGVWRPVTEAMHLAQYRLAGPTANWDSGDGGGVEWVPDATPEDYEDEETGTSYGFIPRGHFVDRGKVGGGIIEIPLTPINPQNPGKKPPCPPVTSAPPGVSLDDNIRKAERHRPQGPVTVVSSAEWFRSMVTHRGDWDYKRRGKPAERGKKAEYEDFGNFNYGATGTAIGFSLAQLLSEGGKLQAVPEGMTEKPKEWGYPAGRFFGSGKYPYGDEPGDAKVVEAGRDYYYHKFFLKDCE